jgi:hypothetical protein
MEKEAGSTQAQAKPSWMCAHESCQERRQAVTTTTDAYLISLCEKHRTNEKDKLRRQKFKVLKGLCARPGCTNKLAKYASTDPTMAKLCMDHRKEELDRLRKNAAVHAEVAVHKEFLVDVPDDVVDMIFDERSVPDNGGIDFLKSLSYAKEVIELLGGIDRARRIAEAIHG